MKRLVIAFIFILIAAGAVAAWMSRGKLSLLDQEVANAPTYDVQRGPFEVTLSSIGVLQASKSAALGAPFEGKVVKLIPEGTRVEEGDPVVWFETTDYEESLKDEKAELALSETDLEQAKRDYELEEKKNELTLESEKTKVEIARHDYDDAKQKYEAELVLYNRDISPQTKVEEARLSLLQKELNLRNAQINLAKVRENLAANLRVKQTSIDQARLRLEDRQRRVDEAQERIDSAILRAPSPGDISYLNIWKSGTVGKIAEGDEVHRRNTIAEVPDTSQMLAIVPINEIDISRVEKGQPAEVTLEALPGQTFPGVVDTKSIVPISDSATRPWMGGNESTGVREFEVRIRLEDSNELFRQGMTASAKIIVQHSDDVLRIPLDGLFMKDGQRGVYIRNGDGGAHFVPLSVKMTNDNFAAVEGKISVGDKVLLRDPQEMDGAEAPQVAAEPPHNGPSEGRMPHGPRGGGES
ncbi:efflux RND transporter periplasmic adaptor subunit [bacterium]|nr:efflux RND transporter periplasmic adaptor subunit [bacterium]